MNIVLCGFMGSGKTVVGKELAKIMGRRFVDTDQLVEVRSGVSIPAIFQVHGEDYFRELERAACPADAALKGEFTHTFSHYKLQAEVRQLSCLEPQASYQAWFTPEQLQSIGLPTPIRKFIKHQ